MKVLVYKEPGKIALEDAPVPSITQPTDVILKVTLSTICGSDIHIVAGHTPVKYPKIVGHEFCGEVVEAGANVKTLGVGDKVAASCIAYCGECFNCKNGHHVHCTGGDAACYGTQGDLDGAQAEFIRVPHADKCLFKIPEGRTEEDMLFVGDILSTGYFAAEQANIKPGDSILIVGAGPVGMCAAMTAKLWGPSQIIMVDEIQSRLDVCKAQGLADTIICKHVDKDSMGGIIEQVFGLTGGRGADRAIEAIGFEETLSLALDAARVGGNVSTIGVFPAPVTLQLQYLWQKALTLTWGFVPVDRMPELMTLIDKGVIDTKFLMTHRAPLNDIEKGYDIFGNKRDGCLKWVITPYER